MGLNTGFVNAEGEVATPFGGLSGGITIVPIDTNSGSDYSSKDIYLSGGFPAGASIGVSGGFGYTIRSVDGFTPIEVDVNFKKGWSVTFLTDEQGFNGINVTWGVGVGYSTGSSKTINTGIVNKAAKFLSSKIIELLNGKKTEPYEYIRKDEDFENYDKNVEEILDGDRDPNSLGEGVQNPVTLDSESKGTYYPNSYSQPNKQDKKKSDKKKDDHTTDQDSSSSDDTNTSSSSNEETYNDDHHEYYGW